MNLRWKTVAGLLLVALVGVGGALVFQRRPEVARSPAVTGEALPRAGSPARGRIVPLVIGEDAPLPAFLSIAAPRESARASAGQLQAIPTLRVAEADSSTTKPDLAQSFPQASELGTAKSEDLTRDAFSPIAPPSVEPLSVTIDKPATSEPLRHVIVDGDTLPLLAERYLGSRDRAGEIFAQNQSLLPAPELLPLGVEITIGAE